MNDEVTQRVAAALWEAASKNGHVGLELEFRLGHRLPGGAFAANVGEVRWTTLRDRLNASKAFRRCDMDTVDAIYDHGYKCVTTTAYSDGPAPPPHWIRKMKLAAVDYDVDGSPHCARAALASEQFAPAPDEAGLPDPRFNRVKYRHRYTWKCWAVDLTRVLSTLPDDLDNADCSYEVEIELLDTGMLFERTMDNIAAWGISLVRDMVQLMM